MKRLARRIPGVDLWPGETPALLCTSLAGRCILALALIKQFVKHAYVAHIGWYMWLNLRRSLATTRQARLATGGAYSGRTPDEAARRALKWANEFRARVPSEDLRHIDFVVEIGPGDSLAMCLLWIGFGAKQVWGVDAFRDPRDPGREKQVFESLLKIVPPEEARRMREVVDWRAQPLQVDADRLRYISDMPASQILSVVAPGTVDFLYSLAVLEHVRDLHIALPAMYSALRPGRRMLHRVDLRNHGVLAEFGEQAFLRPSRFMWKLMGGDKGLHNRKGMDFYALMMQQCEARFSFESDPEFEVDVRDAQGGVASREARVFWLHAERGAVPPQVAEG